MEDGNQLWGHEHQRATLKLQSGKKRQVSKRANKEITREYDFLALCSLITCVPLQHCNS